jgi:predicted nucleotidyltransferase
MHAGIHNQYIAKSRRNKEAVIAESVITLISEFVNQCKKLNIRFEKIILFGSVAAGRMNKQSDIDLALVSKQFSGLPFADRMLIAPAGLNFLNLDIQTYSPADFESGDPFIDEIKSTGIEIKLS